jgi:putative component of toxin-antitoxin plasmid stabilization module
VLGNAILSTAFQRDFLKLRTVEHQSIINEFQKAKNRKLASAFFPDTKIIKDVTPEHGAKCNVYELRIYSPTAIRIYFCETDGKVFVTKIGYKADPDQNSDIKQSHSNLYKLILTAR